MLDEIFFLTVFLSLWAKKEYISSDILTILRYSLNLISYYAVQFRQKNQFNNQSQKIKQQKIDDSGSLPQS